MRLSVLPADKGDCLLLTSKDGRNMLIDGGMRSSYKRFVAPVMGQIADRRGKLDVVCVSHIDSDHISGVLQLFDDMVAWRVHDFQRRNGNPEHRPPASPRPPEVGVIWHNAFHEQLGKNTGPVEEMLAASAAVLSGADDPEPRGLAEVSADLATSVGEGIGLSRRIGDKQLKIPLNPEFGGSLMLVRKNAPTIQLGSMKVSVLAPFKADLEKLRQEWNEWLRTRQVQLKSIQRKAKATEESLLGAAEVNRIIHPALEQASELAAQIQAQALEFGVGKLGQRSKVTVPNLASLMLLVEEEGRSILLTGDGHSDEIVKGLRELGKLDPSGRKHVDVLKLQHHGAEFNIDQAFCDAITADHYVICANGAHENPDLRVLDRILDSRLAAGADDASKPFTMWINSSSSTAEQAKNKAHMQKVEQLLARRTSDRFRTVFRTEAEGKLPIEF